MSDPELPRDDEHKDAGRGINLWLIYGLMFLGLLIAIGLALMIVYPFYQRR